MPRTKSVKFPLLVLRLQFEAPTGTNGYAHIRGWLARNDDRMLDHSDEEAGGKYAGVRITSQTDYHRLVHPGGSLGPLYAVGLEWDRSEGRGLQELRYGVAALGDLEAKLNKMTQQVGPAASMGAWVQRVCTAIGLDQVTVPYKGGHFNPQQAAMAIDHQVADWQEAARSRVDAA